jgi:hypothetical protein
LQPDLPARSLDRVFVHEAFGTDGIDGVVAATTSTQGPVKVTYLVAVNVKAAVTVSVTELGYDTDAKLRYYEANTTSTIVNFDSSAPLALPTCGELDFGYYTITPVLANGWSFVGETDKWVSASKRRFSGLMSSDDEIRVMATGVSGERVTVAFINTANTVVSGVCTIGNTNTVEVSVELASQTVSCY